LYEENVSIVSFTFGCPSSGIISKLQDNGSFVVVTITSKIEAQIAARQRADMLCVQVPRVEVYRALFRNPGAAYPESGASPLHKNASSIRNFKLPLYPVHLQAALFAG
jgi:hypothetical protein